MRKTASKTAPVAGYVKKRQLVKNAPKKATLTVKKRRSRKLIPYLTVPEQQRLFKAIESVRDRAMFRVLYHHGLRGGEIGKLQMSDYRAGSRLDLDRLYIHRLKGSISGECTMITAAALALRAWIRQRGYRPGPLFPSRQGTPITRRRLGQLMEKYCLAAGIPREKSHPHVLKHSCATHLVSDKKESIMDVQKHLGHADIKSTMIYADLTGEANEARAKRLRDWR
jgi:integrase/recombinase XerD